MFVHGKKFWYIPDEKTVSIMQCCYFMPAKCVATHTQMVSSIQSKWMTHQQSWFVLKLEILFWLGGQWNQDSSKGYVGDICYICEWNTVLIPAYFGPQACDVYELTGTRRVWLSPHRADIHTPTARIRPRVRETAVRGPNHYTTEAL